MFNLNITNETSQLIAVVLGRADALGSIPRLEETYDPKSRKHVREGTYPKEKDMVNEISCIANIFRKYGVRVYRPDLINGVNQIFVRDIGFVIEDTFIKANMLPNRGKEIGAMNTILNDIEADKIIQFPEDIHVEGGDIMPYGNYIFVGTYRGEDYSNLITARTNPKAVDALQKLFPQKVVKSFNLRKSNTDPKNNALHLDCCFQPVGKDKAIIHKNGFLDEQEYHWLVQEFGEENVFEITKEEMYNMNSNIFSISEGVVISEGSFTRLNDWLRKQGIIVEEVSYSEISKQGGLFRCSTLPLERR